MNGRIEYKFLAPTVALDHMRADLLPFVVPDAQEGSAGHGAYTVRSIYYDTPRFECYEAKQAGLRVRRKFRIRGYDRPHAESVVFLEIKKKQSDFIDKHRSPVRATDLESLLVSRDIDRYVVDNGDAHRERRDAERFLYHYYRHHLAPAALVVYDREAYFGKYDRSLRITCDMNLRTCSQPGLESLYDEDCLVAAMTGAFIFEVKFHRNALPSWVRTIISRYRLPRMALSKYAICMDTRSASRRIRPNAATPFARALKAAAGQERPRC
ncbi:MAG TPA: polyphosphate polymerase domain-containing protein [Candidatus Eisenbacteria bacterium]|nr:polyphosphate polymerase domain-containing protein [Candidatus Eisenbacteria bacterium]